MEKKVSFGIFNIILGFYFMDLFFAEHKITNSYLLHCDLHFLASNEYYVCMLVLCTFGINFLFRSQVRAGHSLCDWSSVFGVESMYRTIGKYRNIKSIYGSSVILRTSFIVWSRISRFSSYICDLDVLKRVRNFGLQFERWFQLEKEWSKIISLIIYKKSILMI